MNAETRWVLQDDQFELRRVPEDPTLRAWDAADAYAIEHFRSLELDPNARVLLVFDAFGALACGLHRQARMSIGDSHLSQLALRRNEMRNLRSLSGGCEWIPMDTDFGGEFDAAIIKVPREKAILDYALARIRPALKDGASVIGAGMTRHVHTSTVDAFERWIGSTTTSLARQKARLILSQAEAASAEVPEPTTLDVLGQELVVHPGVFAQKFVDPGTQLLLDHVPVMPREGDGRVFVDIGCGVGVLAIKAARLNPSATGIATDESHLAVRSAEENLERLGIESVEVRVDDVMASVPDQSVDLVLSNPPQHQAAAISQVMLGRFLEEARRVLKPRGELRMVANRHVNLNVALSGDFREVRILDQDRRFMVCSALA